jgi:hypothetical protein
MVKERKKKKALKSFRKLLFHLFYFMIFHLQAIISEKDKDLFKKSKKTFIFKLINYLFVSATF